jgi:GNAT superfamily N-acetyltransferase
MDAPQWKIRVANEADVEDLFPIVAEFATSFIPERPAFQRAFQRLKGDDHACLLVADHDGRPIAYLLGFDHLTFFANGPVAWVEEVAVQSSWRRRGVGRALMAQFEEWAASRGAKLVALATRRAAEFYRVLGYTESAVYCRKLL